SIGKIFEFSKFQFLFNFWNYFARNLDNLLIGRLISPSDLGYYDKAYQLSLYPNQILSQVVTPALHPIMSNFQDNISKIGEVYLQISRIFVIVGIPISAYLYFNAQYVVTFMFGDNWSQSVPVFQILAATIWLQMANSPTGAFYQATNQTKLLFRIGLLTSFINILAIVIGVMLQSIQCVAYMLLISFSLSLVINTLYLTKKVLNISAQKYIKPILINLTIISPYIVFNLFISDFVNDLILHLSVQFVILFLIWGIGMYISGEYRRVFAVIRK
ncbi:TPA: oligosaccharide flippase family protein, partial [Streptococcus pneumoniae]|nr:oligosaccharide flippase family protein [Streptococcus pneumoniae]HEV0911755.1 oligosaccharide flippase family protein [Streptococcus pneumoniae]